MSYTVRLVQSRPNTGVEFSSPGSEITTRLEEWKAAGKIESYVLSSISADNLSKTSTIVFGNVGNYAEFFDDTVFNQAAQDRIAHCEANSISYSVETPE